MEAAKNRLRGNLINPFSDLFAEMWETWKAFKKEEFNFEYRGVHSEQVALMNLASISNKNEETAVLIIKQSMGEGWKGLFPLMDKYKVNASSKNNNGQTGIRGEVNDELNRRYGNRR